MMIFIKKNILDFFKSIQTSHTKEMGGLLLGISNDNHCKIYEYLNIDSKTDMFSIKFNYVECKKKYIETILCGNDVDIVGVWHTHLGECNSLSIKDKENLIQMNQITNYPIISVLISTYEENTLIFDEIHNNEIINITNVRVLKEEK